TQIQVLGLNNGDQYRFTVRATNRLGNGPDSAASSATTPVAKPGIPAYRGEPGDGSVKIFPSADANGSEITGYTVIAYDWGDGRTAGQTFSGASGPIVVTGLTNGHRYQFEVTATNALGSETNNPGNGAEIGVEITPQGAPSAPTSVEATVDGSNAASVSFTAPAANGAAITGYTVTATDVTTNNVADTVTATEVASPIRLTGLTTGHNYTFRVAADNEAGTGPRSVASAEFTAIGLPGKPTAVSVRTGPSVVFTEPASSAGSPIDHYVVIASPSPGCTLATIDSCATGTERVTGDSGPIDVNWLDPGTRYYFTVAAVNAAGYGQASASDLINLGRPNAPIELTPIRGPKGITVFFTSPNDHGHEISKYEITATDLTDSEAETQTIEWTGTPSAYATFPVFRHLTSGHSYRFTATATNDLGTGPASEPTTPVTAAGVPDAPEGIVATPAKGAASIAFDTPAGNGAAISQYKVTVTDVARRAEYRSHGSDSCACFTVTGDSSPIALNDLTNAKQYAISVTAVNAIGESAASDNQVRVVPGSRPDSPTGLSVEAGRLAATVSFTAPAANGSTITSYTVTAHDQTDGDATEIEVKVDPRDGTSATVDGLVEGHSYTFTVVANSSNGDSAPSAVSPPMTAVDRPAAPTNLSVTSRRGALEVDFAAATTHGTPITGYTVTATNLDEPAYEPVKATGTEGPITVNSLIPGDAYSLTVTADSAVGSSEALANEGSYRPLGVPGQVAVSFVEAGDRSATINFVRTRDNGSPITNYSVVAHNVSNPEVDGPSANGDSSPITVTGLTPGQAYIFDIVATNAIGDSFVSATDWVIPTRTPDTPSAPVVTIKPGGVASLAFESSAANASDPDPTHYEVTALDRTDVGRTTGAVGDTSPVDVEELVVGHSVVFTVVAKNSSGSSDPVVTDAVVVTDASSHPTAVSATAGAGSAEVSWSAASANGSSVTGYRVTSSPGGKTCETNGAGRNCTVSGLDNGTPYTFTVVATNGVGARTASTASNSVIPIASVTVPGAPTGASAIAGNASAAVSWIAPESDGGAEVTGYKITAAPGGSSCTTNGAGRTCNVVGLTNGTPYTFTAVATNSVGDSDSSTASTSVTPATNPGAPSGVSATAGLTSASVSWTAAAANGSAVSGYTVTSSPGAKTCTTTGGTSCTVSGLTSATPYTFSVVATNGVGAGSASGASNSVIPTGVPAAPASVVATPGYAQATVSWTAPARNGGFAVIGYKVTIGSKSCTALATETFCSIDGLTNGVAVLGTVVAINSEGNGATAAFTVTPSASAPRFTTTDSDAVLPGETLKTTVTVVGKTAPTSSAKAWLAVSGLPTGIKFTPGTGTKAGTGTLTGKAPAVGGVYTLFIGASNATGITTLQKFTLRVLDFADAAPTTATVLVGVPARITISTTDPLAKVTSGTLPAGLKLTSLNGVATITGTPTTAKTTATKVTLTATDSTSKTTQTLSITVSAAPSITVTGTTSQVHATGAFSLVVSAAGVPTPKVTVSGLPTGLAYSSSSGKVTGKIATAGRYTFTVEATNSAGTVSKTVTLTVS
ncbi:MAG: fibronectin type III domain-containing protein, partial [Solirubrobacterales bacterium]|nr:fibronectin type III domain-containing protein [Solirubrobacterales bacterium]